MPLDFKRATDVFLGTERELALALGVSVADLRDARQNPERVPDDLLERLAHVLIERGNSMRRVGELLLDSE